MLSANLRSQVANALLNALITRAVQLLLLLIKLAKLRPVIAPLHALIMLLAHHMQLDLKFAKHRPVVAPLHALILLLAQHMLVPQLAKP